MVSIDTTVSDKISRYVEIRSDKEINSAALKKLIRNELKAYKKRMKKAS